MRTTGFHLRLPLPTNGIVACNALRYRGGGGGGTRSVISHRQHDQPHDDHQRRKQLSHAERSDDEPELRVRLSGKLEREANETVTDEKGPAEQTGPIPTVPKTHSLELAENEKEQNTFAQSLVQLRRMPRRRQRVRREYHRPGHARRPAVELTVDEVPDASEKETGRSRERDRVRDAPERQSTAQ